MDFDILCRESVSKLLSPEHFDELSAGDAYLSQGEPLDDERFMSVKVGTISLSLGEVALVTFPVYVNTLKPHLPSLPTWPRALSLMPDLDERRN